MLLDGSGGKDRNLPHSDSFIHFRPREFVELGPEETWECPGLGQCFSLVECSLLVGPLGPDAPRDILASVRVVLERPECPRPPLRLLLCLLLRSRSSSSLLLFMLRLRIILSPPLPHY